MSDMWELGDIWQRSWDRAGRAAGGQGTGGGRPLWSGCISVLTAAEPRQGPSWELGHGLSTGGTWAQLPPHPSAPSQG